MPLGIARAILTGGAQEQFGPIVDTQAIASMYVGGSTAFKYLNRNGDDYYFVLGIQNSTGGLWQLMGCKFDYSASSWSFGTPVNIGSNTDQPHIPMSAYNEGHGQYDTELTGQYFNFSRMSGTSGSSDAMELARADVNLSTLAVTVGNYYNDGDIHVATGPYENVVHTVTDEGTFRLAHHRRGSFASANMANREYTMNTSTPTQNYQDLNGYGSGWYPNSEVGNMKAMGMDLAADRGRWCVYINQSGALFWHNLDSSGNFYSSTQQRPTGYDATSGNKIYLTRIGQNDKVLFGYNTSGGGTARVACSEATWVNGGNPTASTGSYATFTYNDGFDLVTGQSDDTAYGINYNGTTLDIHEISVSGTTVTIDSTAAISRTLGATPATSGVQDIDARSPVQFVQKNGQSDLSKRHMFAGAYTDSSGNTRVWCIPEVV